MEEEDDADEDDVADELAALVAVVGSWLLPLRPGKRKKREDEVEGVAVDVADDAQFDIAPTA